MGNIIYPDLSYKLNGICFKVHNELGRYRNEQTYTDAIEQNLKLVGLKFQREIFLPESFPGEKAGRNKADFLIGNIIILEIKAKKFLEKQDYYQVKRYLATLNKKLGILVNFRDIPFIKKKSAQLDILVKS